MSDRSTFKIRVIKLGDSTDENAYIQNFANQPGTITTFHSSPVRITPEPSIPILYNDVRLLTFVKNHITEHANTATLYLEHAHNQISSCEKDYEKQKGKYEKIAILVGLFVILIGVIMILSTKDKYGGREPFPGILFLPGGVAITLFSSMAIWNCMGTPSDGDRWDKKMRERIYKKIGYTGPDQANTVFRYEIDNNYVV